MKAVLDNKLFKNLVIIVVTTCLLVASFMFCSTDNEAYAVLNGCSGNVNYLLLGNGYADYTPGIWDFIISGYVYYDTNSTYNVKFHSMKQIITNQGTMIVNDFQFLAHDNDFSEYDTYTVDYIEVEKGETCVIEADWHNITDVQYSKGNGTSEVAYSSQTAGVGPSNIHAGWHQYWYKDSVDNQFHS